MKKLIIGLILMPGTLYAAGCIDNQYVDIVSNAYNVSPTLTRAVITAESNWNPHAVSSKGAIGLMQVMGSTGEYVGISDLNNPYRNIHAGVKYLRYLSDKFENNRDLILAAYNAGPSVVSSTGNVPNYKETIEYVDKVKRYEEVGYRVICPRKLKIRPPREAKRLPEISGSH